MTVTRLRPAVVCAALLEALDASEGRRRRRKRDTTPDAIGMALKRQLLAQSVEADPDPEAFEAWLLERCLTGQADASRGARRARAREVLAEWQFPGRLHRLSRVAGGRGPVRGSWARIACDARASAVVSRPGWR